MVWILGATMWMLGAIARMLGSGGMHHKLIVIDLLQLESDAEGFFDAYGVNVRGYDVDVRGYCADVRERWHAPQANCNRPFAVGVRREGLLRRRCARASRAAVARSHRQAELQTPS
eukprot:1194605-Prorocentrum_minimum.AAC.2